MPLRRLPALAVWIFVGGHCAVGGLSLFGCNSGMAKHADAGAQGGGGTSAIARFCPVERETQGPILSAACRVSVRNIDPMFTCGRASCALAKALDVTCDGARPFAPWVAATGDGAVLLAKALDASSVTTERLVTIEATASRIEDVPPLLPNGARFRVHDALAVTSGGKPWLFSWDTGAITGLRKSETGWRSTNVSPVFDPEGPVELTGATMVGEDLGYLTCDVGLRAVPHLLTFDGSCWSDQIIAPQAGLYTTLATDAGQRPWVATLGAQQPVDGGLPPTIGSSTWALSILSPDGQAEDALTNLPTGALAVPGPPLRLIVGGGDGTTADPLAAVRTQEGIQLFSKVPASDSIWTTLTLTGVPRDPTLTGNCPSQKAVHDGPTDPCQGLGSCTTTMSGSSKGFDLVRTQSGVTYVAWVNYSTDGSYALESVCNRDELPSCYCAMSETSGTGTADLVLARLGGTVPVLSHLRFDMGGAGLDTSGEIAMAARGDTLLVVAPLGKLTYVEIDSTFLP